MSYLKLGFLLLLCGFVVTLDNVNGARLQCAQIHCVQTVGSEKNVEFEFAECNLEMDTSKRICEGEYCFGKVRSPNGTFLVNQTCVEIVSRMLKINNHTLIRQLTPWKFGIIFCDLDICNGKFLVTRDKKVKNANKLVNALEIKDVKLTESTEIVELRKHDKSNGNVDKTDEKLGNVEDNVTGLEKSNKNLSNATDKVNLDQNNQKFVNGTGQDSRTGELKVSNAQSIGILCSNKVIAVFSLVLLLDVRN